MGPAVIDALGMAVEAATAMSRLHGPAWTGQGDLLVLWTRSEAPYPRWGAWAVCGLWYAYWCREDQYDDAWTFLPGTKRSTGTFRNSGPGGS